MPTNTSTATDNNKPLPAPPPPPKGAKRPPIPRSKSHPAPASSASVRPGDATRAYKDAQSMVARRAATPQGRKSEGEASSQACESGEVSESERGVMRKERKDVCHQEPGLGVWEGKGK